MITERQEKILEYLIKEYLNAGEPVSSFALKKSSGLDVSPATVRNDLQALAKHGYIEQTHTSSGRVPTQKAFKHFSDKVENEHEVEVEAFIVRQIEFARHEMEQEMQMMEKLMQTLENDDLFEILNILCKWHKKI